VCTDEIHIIYLVTPWSRIIFEKVTGSQLVIITGSISYKPLISDISVLRVCNKTGGTIKGDI